MLPDASATGSPTAAQRTGCRVRRAVARAAMPLQGVRNGAIPPVRAVHLPLHGVAPAHWQQLEHLLANSRIDQSLVLMLIRAGLPGTDLARHLATPLLDRMQQTEPVPAAWMPLVQQALCDPREVWEPAWLTERARLRACLQGGGAQRLR